MTDHPTLYVHHKSDPAHRPATIEEIVSVARIIETSLLRPITVEECVPIPVRVTWAGRNRIDSELHSRNYCEHMWERGEPRVHLDTTTELYILGQAGLERGELDA